MRSAVVFSLVFAFAAVHCSNAPEKQSGTPPSVKAMPATPADACAENTMPVLGKTECAPVGPATCADGFERKEGAWGCAAIKPERACAAGLRARIGSRDCASVADCKGAFPPAGADRVVHDAAELSAALATAATGSTIALDRGTYGALEINKDVRLVGRCPAEVSITGTDKRGVLVQGIRKVSIEGVTISGFKGGIVVANGAKVELANVALTSNAYAITVSDASLGVRDSLIDSPGAPPTLAIGVSESGNATLTNVDIRDHASVLRVWNHAHASLARSLVAFDGTVESTGMLGAYSDGEITVEESGLYPKRKGSYFAKMGRALDGAKVEPGALASRLRIARSELRADFEDTNWLIGVHEGAKIELEDTTLIHRSDTALDVRDGETSATIKNSAIVSFAKADLMHNALAVLAGAHADLDGVAIVSPSETALFAGDVGARLTVARSLVTGMRTGGRLPEGRVAIGADRGASIVVSDSAIVECEGWALLGMAAGTKFEVARTLIDPGPSVMGAGVVLRDGADLAMTESLVRRSAEAAFTVINSQGLVADSFVCENKIAVRLDGSTFVETNTDARVPGARELIFSRDLMENNEERVGPVPPSLVDPKP